MRTPIYTSKKLEKLLKKVIITEFKAECGILGKWNANVFYVDRKKCWLLSNSKTQYLVILTDIKISDLKAIDEIFKNAFYEQLVYDGIITDFKTISDKIGKLDFLPTDNDRKTIGFQNQRIQDIECWKNEYRSLEDMPIKDLTNRMNTSPIHIGKGRKMSDYTDSVVEIKKLLIG